MGSRETACYATCSISYESKVNNTIKVHVPHMVRKIKAKTNITLRKLPEKYGLRQRLMLIKKELPELPIEPYQRAMTFAIEQCLLPTLWHLELVHCMYMSIAPFLRGLIMSYTLQDIIGSAMVTMSYKDEVFAIENCLNSVSMISDDIISAHYKQICQNTASCLSTHPLSNGPYSRFKEEFLARIDQAYSVLPSSIGGVNSKTLARLLLLISLNRMSFKSKTRKVYYPEKLFVSVRAMNTALAVISTIQSLMKLTSIIDQATYIIDTVIVSLSKVEIKEIFMTCRRYLTALEITNLEMNTMLNHMICFEMLSVGFIYENSVPPLTVSIEHFNKSIMPMRMLSEFYPDLIPSYIPGKLSENEDIWLISTIGFTNIEVTSVPQGFIPGLRPTMRNRSRYRAYSRKSKEAVKYDPSYLEPIDTRKKSTVRSIVTKVFLDKIHRAEDRWRTIFKSKRAGISSINKGSSDSEDEVNRKTTIYKQNKILAGFIDNES
ncbi:uncharacterized protein CMU_006080 [Cryptosporidium muris RN66]|uniref:Uncharacterized protein n=1 Tax=Cryptosporidium muris (strain RN66) TaxID=441375 RepID=B6AHJ0_CRYMR|nr:uncharacterized protein CMU_006080 [Cryptosporidium muris RN66]EEA07685.1 hypothetical protein, conserved [Cryptosporidium muris RN66]|eukprot:XP_002142034.1 hypothetical protein [Cryptosporidium muris RN66]